MKGVYLPGDATAHVKDWDDPRLQSDDEVIVQIKASALCRSDMSIYYGDPLMGGGDVVPGHEPCGVVVETGKAVRHLKKGDRVAVQCFIGCGECMYCRMGEPNLCEKLELLGFQRNGGDAEYMVAPQSTCLKMPDEMSFRTGAIATDALGNLYSTMRELDLLSTDTLAVVGLGPMGLSGVLVASSMGNEVVAIDMVESRLEKAKQLGAAHTINVGEKNAIEAIMDITNGKGVDKSIDCSGNKQGIKTAVGVVRKLGKVAQIGETSEAVLNPSVDLIHKRVTYFGSWYFKMWEWGDITRFIVDKIGDDRAQEIISHSFPLEEKAASEAFKLFDKHETYKVVFEPSP